MMGAADGAEPDPSIKTELTITDRNVFGLPIDSLPRKSTPETVTDRCHDRLCRTYFFAEPNSYPTCPGVLSARCSTLRQAIRTALRCTWGLSRAESGSGP